MITGALQQGLGPRRVAGFKEVVAANPKVEIAAIEDGRWDTATSERLAGQLYARFAATGGLDRVYGMADNQAVAAIKAAEAAGIAVGTGAEATGRGRRQLPEGRARRHQRRQDVQLGDARSRPTSAAAPPMRSMNTLPARNCRRPTCCRSN